MKRIKDAAKWLLEDIEYLSEDPLKVQRIAFKAGGIQDYAKEFCLLDLQAKKYRVIYDSSIDYLPLLCGTIQIKGKKKKLKRKLIAEVLSKIPTQDDGHSYCFFLAISNDYHFDDQNMVQFGRGSGFIFQTFFSFPSKEISRQYKSNNFFDSSSDFQNSVRAKIEEFLQDFQFSSETMYQPIFKIYLLKSNFRHNVIEREGNIIKPDFRKKKN